MIESLGCRVPSNWLSDPSLCWFEWQTLLSGILALAAAILASAFLWKQIRQTETFHQNEIWRQHNATRVVLPLALSAISEVCKKITDNVAHAIEARSDGQIGFETSFDDAVSGEFDRKGFENLSVPENVIIELQCFVESLLDAGDIRHIAELVSSLQILLSRYNEFRLDQPGMVEQLYGLLLDTAKIQLLTDKIFNYSRFVDHSHFSVVGTTSNSEAWNMIHGKAHGLVLHRKIPDLFFPKIGERIERYKENDSSPWNEKFEG